MTSRAITLCVVLTLGAGLTRAEGQASRGDRARQPAGPILHPPAGTAPSGDAQEAPVGDVGVRIVPDTVLVGLPFRVEIRVRAPLGARVIFPAGTDSASAVEALDPRALETATDTSATDVTAVYRLAAWDVGTMPVTLDAVTIQSNAVTRTIPLGALSVLVVPTVPGRGSERIPKPARAFFPGRPAWWLPWTLAAAIALALFGSWLVVRWLRRRSRLVSAPLAPLYVAERELSELDRLGLLEAGESGRYLALVTETVRGYLARRVPTAALSDTTGELMAALHGDARIPIDRLRALLLETDSVKFAAERATTDSARAATASARQLLIDIDAAIVAAEVAARDAAALQAAREFEERRAARAAGARGHAA